MVEHLPATDGRRQREAGLQGSLSRRRSLRPSRGCGTRDRVPARPVWPSASEGADLHRCAIPGAPIRRQPHSSGAVGVGELIGASLPLQGGLVDEDGTVLLIVGRGEQSQPACDPLKEYGVAGHDVVGGR
jgi:hypothetical protein